MTLNCERVAEAKRLGQLICELHVFVASCHVMVLVCHLCVSVCVLRTLVSPAKIAEPMDMPFGGRFI